MHSFASRGLRALPPCPPDPGRWLQLQRQHLPRACRRPLGGCVEGSISQSLILLAAPFGAQPLPCCLLPVRAFAFPSTPLLTNPVRQRGRLACQCGCLRRIMGAADSSTAILAATAVALVADPVTVRALPSRGDAHGQQSQRRRAGVATPRPFLRHLPRP